MRDSAPDPKKERFLTTGQVAARCGVNFRTVIRWIQRGYLKAYRLPGARADHRIPVEEFERFMGAYKIETLSESVGPPRVLIVDDNPLICRAVQRVLKKKNYEMFVAHDGFTAGMLIREQRPDLVILDLRMKGMNGLGVLKSIRENEELKAIKVLIVSGDSQTKLNEALRAGADAALPKPVSNQELLLKVEELIGEEVPSVQQKNSSR